MSTGCALLDHFKPFDKCQPYKTTFTKQEYLDAIGIALFNGFFVHWPVSLFLFNYWKYSTTGPTADFDWLTAVIHVVIRSFPYLN